MRRRLAADARVREEALLGSRHCFRGRDRPGCDYAASSPNRRLRITLGAGWSGLSGPASGGVQLGQSGLSVGSLHRFHRLGVQGAGGPYSWSRWRSWPPGPRRPRGLRPGFPRASSTSWSGDMRVWRDTWRAPWSRSCAGIPRLGCRPSATPSSVRVRRASTSSSPPRGRRGPRPRRSSAASRSSASCRRAAASRSSPSWPPTGWRPAWPGTRFSAPGGVSLMRRRRRSC